METKKLSRSERKKRIELKTSMLIQLFKDEFRKFADIRIKEIKQEDFKFASFIREYFNLMDKRYMRTTQADASRFLLKQKESNIVFEIDKAREGDFIEKCLYSFSDELYNSLEVLLSKKKKGVNNG